VSVIGESRSETTGASRSSTAYFAIVVMILSYCVNAMDRTLFPLILSDVRREYSFNLQQAGLMSTIFTLGMALAGLPTGYLMARYSRKTVMQIGIAIYSIGTIVTVLAVTSADMLVYRAITGIGEAMQLTALLAIFANYFTRFRAAAVGCLNMAYALGAIVGPAFGTSLLVSYGSWRAPMLVFGALGFVMMAVVALTVRPWLSEAIAEKLPTKDVAIGGATTLKNTNTIVLTCLSIIFGLGLYGYLGMYPTFLREELHFAPTDIGRAMSLYGLGALVSIFSGWLGDRFSARLILSVSFVLAALIAIAMFDGPTSFLSQAVLSCALGMVFSGTIFVNLAGYVAKAVTGDLAGRASGIFVTALYGAATVAGYLIGWLASMFGWTQAGNVQLVALCLLGALVALVLKPGQMAMRA
jgi:DHA1 family inner membrane transport protein